MQRLEVSGAVRLIYRSLGVKGLKVRSLDELQPENSRILANAMLYCDVQLLCGGGGGFFFF